MLQGLDYGVIICYFLVTIGVGLYLSKKASGSIDEYFLGGRHIPWFILGISGMATFLDMSGTMLHVSYFYMLGVKGYWVCYRGAIGLALAFLMIFIGKWMNRSGVMTNAELMEFRFGSGKQGHLARVLCAVSILILGVAFVSIFFVGSGKFLAEYLPETITANYHSFLSSYIPEAYIPSIANVCGLVFFVILMSYTVSAGFHGVVYTDVLQAILIVAVIGLVLYKAMSIGTESYYAEYASADWRSITPSWKIDMPAGYEHMRFLGLLLIVWVVSNVFQGFAFPFDSWTSQRFYAAKNERESSLMACQWIVLFGLRFVMMMGLGVLALGVAKKIADPEMALNVVIENFIPVGMKGVFIAALIAAAMSSIDSIVNSSAAYFVKDIYQLYLKPKASASRLVKISYIASIVIVVLGILLAWKLPNLDSIYKWVFMGLFTGILVPNILKWFWWRFNGVGYAFGMGAGIVGAIISQLMFPDAAEHQSFLIVTVIATVGTVIGVFAGKPTDMDVLVKFYKRIRPFGFWEPVRRQCDPEFITEVKKENRRDILLLFPTCIWQVTLFWMMTSLVVKKWDAFFSSLSVVAVLSFVLYKYWYKNLKSG